MSAPGSAGEFVVIGPRKRAVNVGDIFGWRLLGSEQTYTGQVLDVETELAGAKLILVAFFNIAVDDVRSGQERLEGGRMIGHPYITNRTGWLDGLFVTFANAPCVDLGRVGIAQMTGELVDLRGQPADRGDLDLVIRNVLSPPGAIARWLARSG